MKRFFTKANVESLKQALNVISWNDLEIIECPNEAWNYFWNIFYDFYNLYFPLKTVRKNKQCFPLQVFMTPGLLISRKEKLRLSKVLKSNPTAENKEHYVKYRNMYNNLIRKSKKLYYSNKFEKHARDPKKTWETLNEAMNKKKSGCFF